MVRLLTLFLFLTAIASPLIAREQVKIGAAHFLPFIDARRGNPVGGAITDLVVALNQVQSDFQFTIVKTSPEYRHAEFKRGLHDASMFDSIDWGWDKTMVDASRPYLKGGEVYITLAIPGRDDSFFSKFEEKIMIGMAGYHYAFADYNADAEFLRKNYKMRFTKSNAGSVKMVLAGNRGDIAVVSQSFINQYLSKNPKDRQKILISKKYDQEYHHTIVIRKGMELTIEKLNEYLTQLEASGALSKIWEKHQIK